MKRYICELCGYEYDPNIGDPERGVESDTDFDDLPDGWECPVCGASKSEFVEMLDEDADGDADDPD